MGSAAVVPETAYLIPLEAPEATIQYVRGLWAPCGAAPISQVLQSAVSHSQ